ncbi:MAG TPA: DNA repair protein RecN [Acidimicrobiales bacterium]
MLTEISVHDLGVLADLRLALGPGMTAITGETGAGKTLVVEAIELLVGGRADSVLVRPGAAEAVVEGRFLVHDDEHVLARVVPSGGGRSRGYLDGRMCTAGALAELGAGLVDLYGQHAHQSLLGAASQRDALDAFAAVDLGPRTAARSRRREIDEQLASLGGDARARARETDLLRFQLDEIDGAGLADPDEDVRLEAEEDALSAATAHREAAEAARHAVSGDGGVLDGLGQAVGALAGRAPLAGPETRLRDLVAAAQEVGAELRHAAERLQDDPDRLAEVRSRRHRLRELGRKYGATVADIVAYAAETRRRLADLESHGAKVARLEAERQDVDAALARAEDAVGRQRRTGAGGLAQAVEANLRDLAMPRGRVEVRVGPGAGDEVAFLLGANPGEPVLPLSKVASGGELARAMLALRLVLSAGPPTLVFDEVDAGIGGEAAVAVGRALARLSPQRQVLVVTHLPQVAAFADHHVAVVKGEARGRTVAEAAALDGASRVAELSRMLSGQPASATARRHAGELLELAASERSHRAAGALR